MPGKRIPACSTRFCIFEWERRGKVRTDDAVWHARIITYMAGAEAEREILGRCRGGDGDGDT
jgi:hypothetical protein